ncbi:uncharacterized protein LOC129919742 [Episyrphus balteatus]|uniref:uncharacterized protein LOC129905736 n=1 Tax=Episyrphus balteatus TaxID=286459 RepID=UPI0024867A3F|nr:uncharacterized protein LOC129905736 [Episyrphus balteatus]XP_055854197.1 uncharacterized protein LOC129917958 [Episyrphus balteatus]XP_055856732.1 uncharacterized protein LOC129919742 [Episyrphus balteatus]
MNQEIQQEISEIENVSEFNTLINIRELEQNHRYPIMGIKKVQTKFGEKLVVDLGGHDIFLPARYNKLSEKTIQSIHSQTATFCIIYKGPFGRSVKLEITKFLP